MLEKKPNTKMYMSPRAKEAPLKEKIISNVLLVLLGILMQGLSFQMYYISQSAVLATAIIKQHRPAVCSEKQYPASSRRSAYRYRDSTHILRWNSHLGGELN